MGKSVARATFVLLLAFASANALQTRQENVPRFEDYPVPAPVKSGKNPVSVGRFDHYPSSGANRRAISKEALRNGPNFAGRYVVIASGCGSGCSYQYIVDSRTGAILYELPYTLVMGNERYGLLDMDESVRNHPDSSLLIIGGCQMWYVRATGYEVSGDCGTFYYRWDGKGLRLLHTQLAQRRVQMDGQLTEDEATNLVAAALPIAQRKLAGWTVDAAEGGPQSARCMQFALSWRDPRVPTATYLVSMHSAVVWKLPTCQVVTNPDLAKLQRDLVRRAVLQNTDATPCCP